MEARRTCKQLQSNMLSSTLEEYSEKDDYGELHRRDKEKKGFQRRGHLREIEKETQTFSGL